MRRYVSYQQQRTQVLLSRQHRDIVLSYLGQQNRLYDILFPTIFSQSRPYRRCTSHLITSYVPLLFNFTLTIYIVIRNAKFRGAFIKTKSKKFDDKTERMKIGEREIVEQVR